MFSKSILALAAASLTTLLIQTPVQAGDASRTVRDHRTPVQVQIRDHRAPVQVQVRDHRTPVQVQVRDHRTTKQGKVRDHRDSRRNEVVTVARKDCRLGYEQLRRSGYERISILDCRGSQYSYRALKNFGIFDARMNAYSGKMKVSFIGIAQSH